MTPAGGPTALPGLPEATASPRLPEATAPPRLPELDELLVRMEASGASDLHLGGGAPPVFRIDGELTKAEEAELSEGDGNRLCLSMLTEAQRGLLAREHHLDLAFTIEGVARFRANVFHCTRGVAAAIRRVPLIIPELGALGLPPAFAKLSDRPHGLVLVTGPTGCGKSTTMAALIDAINRVRSVHVITLEDPIEFVHRGRRSRVTQREIGIHAGGFHGALKYALRQDPDVVLIGEMRDPETIGAALTMAETGHLVLATLHTNSAGESVNRIVDAFPGEDRDRVRSQLAFVLAGVLTQQLLPRSGKPGRVCATELLVSTPAVRTVIRTDKLHQVQSLMQTGRQSGMRTMAESLTTLCQRGEVAPSVAARYVDDPEAFMRRMGDSWSRP